MIASTVFYMFASIAVISALAVVIARNPVHSVLFLILLFFNTAGLFVLLGAEFIAMVLVIVYVGAVAVFFLFVVMMLETTAKAINGQKIKYIPSALLIGFVLLVELVTLYLHWSPSQNAQANRNLPFENLPPETTNTHAIGNVLYTDYILIFQLLGLVLLVAMIGAIVLSGRKRIAGGAGGKTGHTRHQTVSEQHARRPEDVLKINKVTPGTGI